MPLTRSKSGRNSRTRTLGKNATVQSAENNSPQDLNKSVEKRICKVDITPLNSTHLENQAVGSSTARVLQDLQNKIDSKDDAPKVKSEKITRKNDITPLTDTSDEDSDDDMLSSIMNRQNRIRERKQKLVKELAIVEMVSEVQQSYNRPVLKIKAKREFKSKGPPLPVRKSMRLLRKDPAGADLPPPPIQEKVDINPRKPGTEWKMKANGFDLDQAVMENMETDEVKEYIQSAMDYSEFMKGMKCFGKSDYKPMSEDLKEYQSSLRNLKIIKFGKIVPARTFSVAIHSSVEKTFVVAGDKYGHLGMWDVMSEDANNGIYQFHPHSKPISCLKFSPSDPNKLYTTSYDGLMRCCDLQTNVFEEAIVDDEEAEISCFDFLDSTKTFVTSIYDGRLGIIDSRLKSEKHTYFQAHKRGAKSISVHPVKKQYVASSSKDSTVRIFDLRKISSHGMSTPLIEVAGHRRSVSSAYFSPITGNYLLTTSYDDHLRVFDTSNIVAEKITMKSCCRHNNNTGRWLSSFRATWHPARDDALVVGCMLNPRQIEVFDCDLGQLSTVTNSDVLTSICSVNCFHPTNNILVGCNSSGKVFVFSG